MSDEKMNPPRKVAAKGNDGGNAVVGKILGKVAEANNILVALSNNPTVDELSAALGLTLLLDAQGKHATAIFSGKIPEAVKFLNPEKTFEKNTDSLQDFIIALNKDKADHLRYKVEGDYVKVFITPYKSNIDENDLEFSRGDYNVDLVISLDVASGNELDAALMEHGRIIHDATVINITDHEAGKLGEIEWSDPKASSVSEMIASLVIKDKETMGEMNKAVATAFLTGIVAATERFSNAHTAPDTMAVSARLMMAGADQQLIATRLQEAEEVEKAELEKIAEDAKRAEETEKTGGAEETAILEDLPEEEMTDVKEDPTALDIERDSDDGSENMDEQSENTEALEGTAEPVTEEPVAEEPVIEEPVADSPTAEELIAEEPVANTQVVEEPMVEEESATEAIANDAVVEPSQELLDDLANQQSEAPELEQVIEQPMAAAPSNIMDELQQATNAALKEANNAMNPAMMAAPEEEPIADVAQMPEMSYNAPVEPVLPQVDVPTMPMAQGMPVEQQIEQPVQPEAAPVLAEQPVIPVEPVAMPAEQPVMPVEQPVMPVEQPAMPVEQSVSQDDFITPSPVPDFSANPLPMPGDGTLPEPMAPPVDFGAGPALPPVQSGEMQSAGAEDENGNQVSVDAYQIPPMGPVGA